MSDSEAFRAEDDLRQIKFKPTWEQLIPITGLVQYRLINEAFEYTDQFPLITVSWPGISWSTLIILGIHFGSQRLVQDLPSLRLLLSNDILQIISRDSQDSSLAGERPFQSPTSIGQRK